MSLVSIMVAMNGFPFLSKPIISCSIFGSCIFFHNFASLFIFVFLCFVCGFVYFRFLKIL